MVEGKKSERSSRVTCERSEPFLAEFRSNETIDGLFYHTMKGWRSVTLLARNHFPFTRRDRTSRKRERPCVLLLSQAHFLKIVGKLMHDLFCFLLHIPLNQQPHRLGGLDADERKLAEHEGRIANNAKGGGFSFDLFDLLSEGAGL